MSNYEDLTLRAHHRGPSRTRGIAPRRCWLAVPDGKKALCTGGRGRFDTLTEFEQHIRDQEMALAATADAAAFDRRVSSTRRAAKERAAALGIPS